MHALIGPLLLIRLSNSAAPGDKIVFHGNKNEKTAPPAWRPAEPSADTALAHDRAVFMLASFARSSKFASGTCAVKTGLHSNRVLTWCRCDTWQQVLKQHYVSGNCQNNKGKDISMKSPRSVQ